MNILLWVTALGGIFNISMALIMNTKNFSSSLLFKIIPFMFGMIQLVCALQVLEIIDVIR